MTQVDASAEDLAVEELRKNLDDPYWRLCNLYKIIVKDDDDDEGLVMRFRPNRAQRRLLRRLHNRNIVLKARQLGYCLDPATRVLTADLRWVPIASLQPGDEVVAVDEHPHGGKGSSRKMRTATVEAAAEVHRMAYRITFDDGREVVCTDRHPWLSRSPSQVHWDWRSIVPREGQGAKKRLKVGSQVRWVTRPWEDGNMEDGWFGGMLDGEGSMSKDSHTPGVSVSQREGQAWDRLVDYAESRGYHACIECDGAERPSKFGRAPVPKLAFGRMDELFRLIGQTRPTRFVGRRFWEGRFLPGRRNGENVGVATIVKIEPVGMQTMIDLQTSTGTYIAEGFVSHNTTLIAILWLDTALFSKGPIFCGIIAHEKDAGEAIFRDKVLFAYEHLPDELREEMPLRKKTETTLVFKHNGATIKVATSVRSATIHRLHVSEYGKICAKYPAKAKEVVTGSIPTVPSSGILVIESTAEGQDGDFYAKTQRALDQMRSSAKLTSKDYLLTFSPWWDAPDYTMDPEGVLFTEAELQYFHEIEAEIGREIDDGRRAWYVSTLRNDFSGESPLMWQEFPSTPEEAFKVSTEGCYYARQLADARKAGRIRPSLPVEKVPVYTFWDLGRGDMTAIWLMQKIGPEYRWIGYYENSGEELDHYAKWLLGRGLLYGRHYLPHDAGVKRLGQTKDTNKTLKEQLEDLLPGHRVEIVPRVTNIQSGINSTRELIAASWFDETACDKGMPRLARYRKEWDKVRGCWKDTPLHDDASHGADAYRQAAQVIDAGEKFDGISYTVGKATGVAAVTRTRWGANKRGRGSAMAA